MYAAIDSNFSQMTNLRVRQTSSITSQSKSLSNYWMNCQNSFFFSDNLTLAAPRAERNIRWIAMKTSRDVITVVVVGTVLLTETVTVAVD